MPNVLGNFSPSMKNFSSPSPHQPPRGFHTCSITPTSRPRPVVLSSVQSIPRSGSLGNKASRCHFAWNRPSVSIGRVSGAWAAQKLIFRALVPSLTIWTLAPAANGMYQ